MIDDTIATLERMVMRALVLLFVTGCVVAGVDQIEIDRSTQHGTELAPGGGACRPPSNPYDLPWCSTIGCSPSHIVSCVAGNGPCTCDTDDDGACEPFECRPDPAPDDLLKCSTNGCAAENVANPDCFQTGATCVCDLDGDGPAEPFECSP